jgi:hypothetical protein
MPRYNKSRKDQLQFSPQVNMTYLLYILSLFTCPIINVERRFIGLMENLGSLFP